MKLYIFILFSLFTLSISALNRPTKNIHNDIDYRLALRTNLLYDIALIPNVGAEYKFSNNWSASLDVAWTHINWNEGNKHYRLFTIAPEARYYFSPKNKFYTGMMAHAGQVNLKFGQSGEQGNIYGGGFTFGYVAPLTNNLSLDFGLGLGYTRFDYEKYVYDFEYNYKTESKLVKNIWGPTKIGASLVWKIN